MEKLTLEQFGLDVTRMAHELTNEFMDDGIPMAEFIEYWEERMLSTLAAFYGHHQFEVTLIGVPKAEYVQYTGQVEDTHHHLNCQTEFKIHKGAQVVPLPDLRAIYEPDEDALSKMAASVLENRLIAVATKAIGDCFLETEHNPDAELYTEWVHTALLAFAPALKFDVSSVVNDGTAVVYVTVTNMDISFNLKATRKPE